MTRAYAKFWRDLDAAGLTKNHKACALYCHLLCAASVTARRVVFNGVTVNIQPGQVVTSRSELSAFLGLTDKEVRGAIKTLEKLQLVGQQGASKYTLITLINSDGCDNEGPTEGQQKGQERAKSGPAEGPGRGQLLYKEGECRKRMEKGEESLTSASGDAPRAQARKPRPILEGKRLESFERFWDAYGYKKGRGGAEKAWAAIPTLTDSLVEQICEAARKEAAQRPALEAQGRSPKWAQGWLNERRWEDDYEATQPQTHPAYQPQGQQKTWAEINDEKMKQDCLKGMYDYMDMMGIVHEENENADEQPCDHWTAEVIDE